MQKKKDIAEWVGRIARAPDAATVLVLANEFLIRLPLAVRAFLPKSCTPRELKTIDDLNDYAYRLRMARNAPATEAEASQQQVATVMAQAAQRMAQLMAANRSVVGIGSRSPIVKD